MPAELGVPGRRGVAGRCRSAGRCSAAGRCGRAGSDVGGGRRGQVPLGTAHRHLSLPRVAGIGFPTGRLRCSSPPQAGFRDIRFMSVRLASMGLRAVGGRGTVSLARAGGFAGGGVGFRPHENLGVRTSVYGGVAWVRATGRGYAENRSRTAPSGPAGAQVRADWRVGCRVVGLRRLGDPSPLPRPTDFG